MQLSDALLVTFSRRLHFISMNSTLKKQNKKRTKKSFKKDKGTTLLCSSQAKADTDSHGGVRKLYTLTLDGQTRPLKWQYLKHVSPFRKQSKFPLIILVIP